MDGDKKPVRLSIFNQTFSLLVSGDPDEIQAAAEEVDQLMHTIARSGNMDTAKIAILACLHLQDRVSTLESEFGQFQRRIEDTSRRFSFLLDEAIASAANHPNTPSSDKPA